MMKYLLILLTSFLLLKNAAAQPGLYAGSANKMIGKKFTAINPDKLFTAYQYTGGFLLDDSRQEFEVWISLYKKGNTHLVVMYALDTLTHKNSVLDILELKLPDAVTNIQCTTCSINGEYSHEIIAVERKRKILNGWRALRDKLRFQKMEKVSLSKINCIVEGI
jgi:hypothetical protein